MILYKKQFSPNVKSIIVRLLVSYTSVTLLLEPEVISLCHQYRTRPAALPCSLSRLYTVG